MYNDDLSIFFPVAAALQISDDHPETTAEVTNQYGDHSYTNP